MEIRRKVFSLLQNENGEEKLFSTNEFELQEQENEKLFSTGDSELDDILEEVYYSGLEDGYNYFEYEQREFGENKRKQKVNALRGSSAATGALSGATQDLEVINKFAPEFKKFQESGKGGIKEFKEYLKEQGRHGDARAFGSRFSAPGKQQDALMEAVKGIDASQSALVQDKVQGAKSSLKISADNATRYGNTRPMVATSEGLNIEAGERKGNIKTAGDGRVEVKTTAGAHEGNRTTHTVSEANKGRANKINRDKAMPKTAENNTKLTPARRNSVPRKYKVNANVPETIEAAKGLPETSSVLEATTPGKNKLKAITDNGKITEAASERLTRGGETVKTVVRDGKSRTTKIGKVGTWVRNNKGKAVLIGTGLVATGAAAGIAARNNKNKRGSARA